jgi:hypothetical protein
LSLLSDEDRRQFRTGRSLVLAVAAGPSRLILRPSELEQSSFQEDLQQMVVFGADRIFTPSEATTADVEEHALVLTHDVALAATLAGGIPWYGERSASRMRACIPTAQAGQLVEDLITLLRREWRAR